MTNMGFWDFSLAVYKQPCVEQASLDLQDRQGFDVNLALWCVWLSMKGRKPGSALSTAIPLVESWNGSVTYQLRELRRSVKGVTGAETVYRKLLDAELECECLIQGRLDELFGQTEISNGSPRETARLNLADYAHAIDRKASFERFISAVFQSREMV